ncbi:MAG: hypothetical protein EBU70_13860, partial [Actinobacteria bacterium]|nr:hypothetical protein [Actinomycetota bacterium]
MARFSRNLLACTLACTAMITSGASGQPTAPMHPRVSAIRAVPLAGLLPEGAAGPVAAAAHLVIDDDAWREMDRHDVAWLDGMPLSDGSAVDLRLTRVEPFTQDARIVVVESVDGRIVERELPRPELSAWAGQVAGRPGSRALIVRSAAGLQGYIQFDGRTEIISSGEQGASGSPMIADASQLGITQPVCEPAPAIDPADELEAASTPSAWMLPPACRQLPVAVDTDQELLAKFSGNTTAATAYVATLFAGMSDIYTRDFNIRPGLCYLRWWSTTDPWTITSGTSAQLTEFRTYWNTNMRTTPRSLATLLSARGLGGGVAWLGQTCASTAGSGYGYSVCANLAGSFPYP